ncbi:MAG: TIGR03905 family TSCPD domain-containing protein [Oscillospiraceae bacterium]|nr:TIGR03905 family TSCPD domain-containing protein [Oscillospiraceae bacterium]
MQTYTYRPTGPVCSRQISFTLDDGKLRDVRFVGGCDGNLKAIGKLVEGADARHIAEILRGNDCGGRGTSCADQLARAVTEALED